jgi:hypothetical protein
VNQRLFKYEQRKPPALPIPCVHILSPLDSLGPLLVSFHRRDARPPGHYARLTVMWAEETWPPFLESHRVRLVLYAGWLALTLSEKCSFQMFRSGCSKSWRDHDDCTGSVLWVHLPWRLCISF